GNLHMGHALTIAVEDVLIRYNRMLGKPTLFLPGADHAGFETWVVYERQLEKEGKSRFDFSREELYKGVWDFVHQHRGNMEVQLKELGASLDWGHLTFTLDKKVVKTAYQTFKALWDDGLVYRGKRLVNYCTKHHTAFADIEVEYEDRTTPLYYLKYGPFELATTRPETKFGDTGVAVHPDDMRYKEYVGKEIEVEGVNGLFTVRVVADDHVDPTFGTGVVKVTPAHDFNDWEMGQTHNLPAVPVIDLDGKMTERAGKYAGMTVLEARKAVVEAMKEKGILLRVDENYKNRVGVCYKCGTVIEPVLLDQWFLKVEGLAQRAKEAVEKGDITFSPASRGKALINYYENLHDWNLSRQIPWGIPIPAFQNVDDPEDWIFDERVELETIEVDGKTYKRDEDTFDTWFSSGQWPFVTTDFMEKGELSKFYPLDVMETGYDILYAWVAKMIMLGLYRTDQVPFRHVYLHGLVLDEHGQKMSKSKGNVLNPQELMSEYGSDALRMGLLASRSAGISQAFSSSKVVAGRNFANKLWNIARFIEDRVGEEEPSRDPEPFTDADHWIIRQLNDASKRIGELISDYRFAEAYELMYHTVWDDFADWYIEASKVTQNTSVLTYALETILKFSHPFAPFVTETIWQTLKWEDGLLITSSWPAAPDFDAEAAKRFEGLQAIVSEARTVTTDLGQGKQTLLYRQDELIDQTKDVLVHLARLKSVEQVSEARGLRLAVAHHEAWLDIDEETLAEHKGKLQARIDEAEDQIKKLQGRLSNKSYVDNAPEAVVQQTRDQLTDAQTLVERLQRELTVIS
ncbi:MAG TPA: valine--tRNA ligase, partial [Candidatus Saccharimonadales bacterium]|nr:valine--tRNA ligase [Candidatus Saccharimonadales bacterium]